MGGGDSSDGVEYQGKGGGLGIKGSDRMTDGKIDS